MSSNVASSYCSSDYQKGPTARREVKKLGASTSFLLKVVYLPFNLYWQWAIQFSILTAISTDIYYFYFVKRIENNLWLHYIIEVIYLIDTALAYVHRYRKDIRKFSTHSPRSLLVLAIDTLSLIPVFEFYFIALPDLTSPEFFIYVRMKNVLRIYHLVAFLFYKRYDTTVMHIATILMTHFLVLIFFNLVFALLWAIQGSCYPNCTEPNWSKSLDYFHIEKANFDFDWFILCYSTMGSILVHCWPGFILDHDTKESFIIIGVLMTGLITHQWIELAHLISCFVQLQQNRFEYLRLLKRLDYVFRWGASKQSRKRILSHYELLWHKQGGIFYKPKFIKCLPTSLLHECLIDIYWDALRHSHLFAKVGHALKKNICANMKTEYLSEGDFLIHRGSHNYKMFYLVSGFLHVISAEDNTTPILSFSSGTLIGELNLVILRKAKVDVKCATACEVKSLDMLSYARSVLLFGHNETNIHMVLKERITLAKSYQNLRTKHAFNQDEVNKVLKRNNDIKKLKSQWRKIQNLHSLALHNKILGSKSLRTLDKFYYSVNLDMLVLEDKGNTDYHTICESSRCPYILNPDSDFRRFLNYLHLSLVVFYSVLLPYLLVFYQDISFSFYLICLVVDFFFLFDIYVQAITYIKDGEREIRKPMKVLIYRLNEITFLVDLVSAIPYDYVAILTELSIVQMFALKLPKLIQIYKVFKYVSKQQNSAIKYAIFLIIIKYAAVYSFLLYYSICIQYFIFNFGQHAPDTGLPSNSPLVGNPIGNCIVYSVSVITQTGMSGRTPINIPEMITYLGLTFLASYVQYFIICELLSNIVKHNEEKYNHFKRLKAIHKFLIGKSLVTKFLKYAYNYSTFQWNFNKNIIIDPGKSKEMPEYELIVAKIVSTFRKVPLFNNYSEELLTRLAHHADVRVLPPSSLICEAGKRSLYLHIITKGYCHRECQMPGDAEKRARSSLSPGKCFPILASLHYLNCLNTIYSSTTVEEISISVVNVFKILQYDPLEQRSLMETLAWHRAKFNTILTQTPSDFHAMARPSMKFRKKLNAADFFRYDEFEKDDSKERDLKNEHRKLGVFQYVLFKYSIDPQGHFYTSWEVFRSVFLILYIALTTGQYTYLRSDLGKDIIFFYALAGLIICCLDIYIRLHVQYYNDENIKVVSVRKTSLHYLQTSFITDVICTYPNPIVKLLPVYIGGVYYSNVNLLINVIRYASMLYRPLLGLRYIEKNSKGFKHYFAKLTFYGLIGFIVSVTIAKNMFLSVCVYDSREKIFNCKDEQHYISTSPFANESSAWVLSVLSLYAVSERVTTNFVGVSEYQLTNDLFNSLLQIIVSWFGKLIAMCLIMAASITGNSILLNQARTRFYNFTTFVKREGVSLKTIDEFKDHFEYVTSKTDGNDMIELLRPFHHEFRLDIKRALFQSTLLKTRLLHGLSPETLQIFYDHFNVKYYKINADIVRCNDVNKTLYVVSKGTVDISVANYSLVHLECGGVFGSFLPTGSLRQLTRAKALVHVELLTIPSDVFYNFIKPYPWIVNQIERAKSCGIEFFEPVLDRQIRTIDEPSEVQGRHHVRLRNRFTISRLIRSNNIHFRRYVYAVVHIGPLSSIILVVLLFELTAFQIYMYVVVCDIFFWFYIILNFHLEYTDPELGTQINDLSLIRKRYAKSFLFWITLLGTLPVEIIPYVAGASSVAIATCYTNRFLRFGHILKYHHDAKKELTFNTLLQWFYMIYVFAFQISVMSLFWFTVACDDGKCYSRIGYGPSKEMGYSESTNGIVLSFLYILIMYTSSGLRTVSSLTLSQLLFSACISLASVLTTSLMTGIFASLIIMKSVTINNYKGNVYKLQKYMKSQGLSPYLRKKIDNYVTSLWFQRSGELIPKLIPSAPTYLQQDIMFEMYGTHLSNHPVFRNMHLDLMRQVCVLFKVSLYTPHQLIVEKGDIDGAMYFLHRGEVRIIDNNGMEIVGPGFSFGEEQGLYKIPHDKTYIAYTTLDLLVLEYHSWAHLLDHFPASRNMIFQEITVALEKRKSDSSSTISEISVMFDE